jgi:hypothetical protein
MPREFTLEDLATGAEQEAAQQAAQDAASEVADGSDGETAKWLTELYSQMRDDGTLQAILFGPDAAKDMTETPTQPQTATATEEESEQVDPTEAIDAETIAAVGNLVIEQVGDMPLSKIVEACEERPATINQVLESHSDELAAITNDDAPEIEEGSDQ